MLIPRLCQFPRYSSGKDLRLAFDFSAQIDIWCCSNSWLNWTASCLILPNHYVAAIVGRKQPMQKYRNRVGVYDHFSTVLMANELVCRCAICKNSDHCKCADFADKLGVEAVEPKVLVWHDFPNVKVRLNFARTQNNCNSCAIFICGTRKVRPVVDFAFLDFNCCRRIPISIDNGLWWSVNAQIENKMTRWWRQPIILFEIGRLRPNGDRQRAIFVPMK